MNLQEVFIYPTALKYDYENKNLIFNCFINDEEKQTKQELKFLNYYCNLKIINKSKKHTTNEEFEKDLKSLLGELYAGYKIERGYNLYDVELIEGKNGLEPTQENIYIVYLNCEYKIKKSIINKINKYGYLVVEDELIYKPIKFQKDVNIFLFNWCKVRILEGVILDVIATNKEEMDNIKNPNLNICCYDIETYYDEEHFKSYSKTFSDKIGSICLKYNDDKPIILLVNTKIQEHKIYDNYELMTFETELKMLEYFINNYFNNFNSVDCIYGYNNLQFDDVYIIKKFEFLSGKTLYIDDRIIKYDSIKYIKNTFSKSKDFKLKTQMKMHLSHCEKIDLSYKQVNKLFNDYENHQDITKLNQLILYNIRDVIGTYKLENKIKGFFNYLAISKLASKSINDFIHSQISSVINTFIYKMLNNGIYIYNTKTNNQSYQGAHVELTKQLLYFYKNIMPFDFKSLYPSILMFYNLSPDTQCFNPEHYDKCYKITFKDVIIKKTNNIEVIQKDLGNVEYYFYKTEHYKGFFTNLLKDLGDQRTAYKKLKKINFVKYEALQVATKLIMNSIYGKLGEQLKKNTNKTFTISNRAIASSITMLGRENIKLLRTLLSGEIPLNKYQLSYDSLEDKEFLEIQERLKTSEFLYTDTDSVYIQNAEVENISITDIEHKYLSKLFKMPLYAEAEDFITHMNITKPKNYIYRLQDLKGNYKIKTNGWKKGESEKNKNLHTNIFNHFINNDDCDILEHIRNTYKNIVIELKEDAENIKNKSVNYEYLLNKYTTNLKLNGEQIYKKLKDKDKLKSITSIQKLYTSKSKRKTDEENKKITDKNKQSIIDSVNIESENLGILKQLGNSYFINYLYDKNNIIPDEMIKIIQLDNYWNNNLLKSIKSINALPVNLINNTINLDKNHYLSSIKKRINNGIYKDAL